MPEKRTFITFNFTPQIFRYLEDIIEIGETTHPEADDELFIDNYKGGETLSADNELNNLEFWSYLIDIGAIAPIPEKGIEGLKVGETVEIQFLEKGGRRIACLPKRYFYLLDYTKVKQLYETRLLQGNISLKGLELVAKEIASHQTGTELIKVLKGLGVPSNFIVYPNTKWRMLFDIFRVLNTSLNHNAQRMLYRIIESYCHPFLYDGDEVKAKEVEEKLNTILKYEDIQLSERKLYRKIQNTTQAIDDWINSDGEVQEPKVYLVTSEDVSKLYVYWNALVKITKFYLADKENQDEELSEIYFEILQLIEKTLENNNCGGLKEKYKRPFRNIIGCEFEFEDTNDLLVLLFNFLGEITNTSLPVKAEVEQVRKEHNELFKRIEDYSARHKPVDEKLQSILTEALTPPRAFTQMQSPIPIQIIGETNVKLVENEAAESKEQKFPKKLPAGTKWENFVIKFLDTENILVLVKGFSQKLHYSQMGFVDNRNHRPNTQWALLYALAENNGELTWESVQATDKNKKRKQLLTEALQTYFRLDTDPFHPYKDGKSYKTKITIMLEDKNQNIEESQPDIMEGSPFVI